MKLCAQSKKPLNNLIFQTACGYDQVTINGVYHAIKPLCFCLQYRKDYKKGKNIFIMIDHDGIRHNEYADTKSEGMDLCLVSWFNYHLLRYELVQDKLRLLSNNNQFAGLIVREGSVYRLQYFPLHRMLDFLKFLGFEHHFLAYEPNKKKEVLVLKQIKNPFIPNSDFAVSAEYLSL